MNKDVLPNRRKYNQWVANETLEDYALVVQCGGCMITRKQLHNRLDDAKSKEIPITNYGMAIAYVHGIYNRAVAPFLKVGSEVGTNYL